MNDKTVPAPGAVRAEQPTTPPALPGGREYFLELKAQVAAAVAGLQLQRAGIEAKYEAEYADVARRKADEIREVTSLLADFGVRDETAQVAPANSGHLGVFFRDKLKPVRRACKTKGFAPSSRAYKLRMGLERARIVSSSEFAQRFPSEAAMVRAGRIDIHSDVELAVRHFDMPLPEMVKCYEAGDLDLADIAGANDEPDEEEGIAR